MNSELLLPFKEVLIDGFVKIWNSLFIIIIISKLYKMYSTTVRRYDKFMKKCAQDLYFFFF